MTQNPWQAIKTHDGYRAVIDSQGFTICSPSPMSAQSAALISAAPELIEALFMALPYVEDHEGSEIYKTGTVAAAVATIRAALKKATEQTT